MDFLVNLGLTPSLHLHASGAITYCAAGEGSFGWDDDTPLLTVEA